MVGVVWVETVTGTYVYSNFVCFDVYIVYESPKTVSKDLTTNDG